MISIKFIDGRSGPFAPCAKMHSPTPSLNTQSCIKRFLVVKFTYSEKAKKFGKKILTVFWNYLVTSKQSGRFFQIFWPSQNIWTLRTYAMEDSIDFNLIKILLIFSFDYPVVGYLFKLPCYPIFGCVFSRWQVNAWLNLMDAV